MGIAVGRRPAQPGRHPDTRAQTCGGDRNRLLYRDGVPIAALAGGEVRFYDETLDAGTQWQVRKALLRGATPLIMGDLSSAVGSTTA